MMICNFFYKYGEITNVLFSSHYFLMYDQVIVIKGAWYCIPTVWYEVFADFYKTMKTNMYVSLFQEDNVLACLPVSYTQSQYDSKDRE